MVDRRVDLSQLLPASIFQILMFYEILGGVGESTASGVIVQKRDDVEPMCCARSFV
jgi:hypothetical protein